MLKKIKEETIGLINMVFSLPSYAKIFLPLYIYITTNNLAIMKFINNYIKIFLK